MAYQDDALKELIREANGTRKDLEREKKEVAKMLAEAAKLRDGFLDEVDQGLKRYIAAFRVEIEQKFIGEIDKAIAEAQQELKIGAQRHLQQIREDMELLRNTLLGKEPIPPSMLHEWREANHYHNGEAYYPDLEVIVKAWPELDEDQRNLVRLAVEGGASTSTVELAAIAQVLPNEVITAIDPTRKVVSKLEKIRKRRKNSSD